MNAYNSMEKDEGGKSEEIREKGEFSKKKPNYIETPNPDNYIKKLPQVGGVAE